MHKLRTSRKKIKIVEFNLTQHNVGHKWRKPIIMMSGWTLGKKLQYLIKPELEEMGKQVMLEEVMVFSKI
jgi:hypothetical protein